ncbi:hypothetical protein Pcar_2571 [Syntrophotalea carbinolica DSM 2380]|uniref:Uncharacterized protein n=1 Tax=Syntrophotalea carbinolica (strain DSM 2380 / NBRC 103641 / GraBd1) TaxID=338963 RepID=Q3A1E8_SYNC1|nr:hypothetical protein [Syntrophotalea carbinolica]ABA89809.1 hypothetical protein Pcar_2571 [Syntrophotalea carbinolica DSM 2380]
MNPLVPSADILPASWPLLQGLLLIVFPLHLLAMNGLLGTAMVVLLIRRRRNRPSRVLAKQLTGTLPTLMAVTINLGVASLLFSQTLHGQFFYPGAILMGRFWLAIIPLLMAVYAGLYALDLGTERLAARSPLLTSLAVVLLMIVAFIFTNNQTLILNLQRWAAYFHADGGTLLNLGDPTLLPRYLHFVTAAMAGGGLFTALVGARLTRSEPRLGAYAQKLGLQLLRRMTLVQMGVGMLFLWQLPQSIRWQMLGGSLPATGLLVTAVSLALALLASSAQGLTSLSAALLAVQVFVMSGLREMIRHASLKGQLRPADMPVVWQEGGLMLFVLVLLVGMTTIGWLVRQAVRPAENAVRGESEQNRAFRL